MMILTLAISSYCCVFDVYITHRRYVSMECWTGNQFHQYVLWSLIINESDSDSLI